MGPNLRVTGGAVERLVLRPVLSDERRRADEEAKGLGADGAFIATWTEVGGGYGWMEALDQRSTGAILGQVEAKRTPPQVSWTPRCEDALAGQDVPILAPCAQGPETANRPHADHSRPGSLTLPIRSLRDRDLAARRPRGGGAHGGVGQSFTAQCSIGVLGAIGVGADTPGGERMSAQPPGGSGVDDQRAGADADQRFVLRRSVKLYLMCSASRRRVGWVERGIAVKISAGLPATPRRSL